MPNRCGGWSTRLAATVFAATFALLATIAAVALPWTDESVAAPRSDRALEEAEERVDAHTRAVEDAHEALDAAEAELEAAASAADEAAARVEQAREAADEARRELEKARRAEELTESELTEVLRQTERSREQAGAVAGAAYRAGGTVANWSVLLETDSPRDFTDTYVDTRTLLRAGDAVLHDLAQQQSELAEAAERFEMVQEDRHQKVEAAAKALEQAEQAVASAREAEQRLAATRAARAEALDRAEVARAEDYRRYQELLAESETMSTRLAEQSETGSVTATGTGTFVRPGTGSVTSRFGSRLHPILGYVKQHTGIDLSPGDGYIYAADDGVVVEAAWNNAYGNVVVIDHGMIDGRNIATLYAHQAGLSVAAGDVVPQGQPIGTVGSTGYSTGPHLHFEVRVNGTPVDPWPWIADAPLP